LAVRSWGGSGVAGPGARDVAVRPGPRSGPAACVLLGGIVLAGLLAGCRPADYRQDADRAAYAIIGEAQKRALGKAEPFTVDSPADALRRKLLIGQDLQHAGPASVGADQLAPIAHWPQKEQPPGQADSGEPPWAGQSPLGLSLNDALSVAARNNREYQTSKEQVFRAALDLDLEANQFRSLFFADAEATYEADLGGSADIAGLANSGSASWQRKLKSGTLLTAAFAVDLVKLLTQDRASALGLFADATITIPLLRGAGRHIVTEPLTQAERDVAYALWRFERYKRTLAVRVASEYLDVLRQLDQVRNVEENYRRLVTSTRRARRLAEAGRLPQIQVDQALQDELRARDRWISAQQDYHRRLDDLKITLGLPTDANIGLDRGELERLAEVARQLEARPAGEGEDSGAATQPTSAAADAPIILQPPRRGGGPLEIAEAKAIDVALANRLDLRTALGRVYDAQRGVVVAADALKMGLTFTGTAAIGERRGLGSASQEDAQLRFDKGAYSLGLWLDLPLERTAERNAYRESFIALEQAVREVQALEDEVKREIREALRRLLQTRESYQIQARAVALAERRIKSTELFLQAGRAQIRDVLEAQEALVSAQNALTAALVSYRTAELQLQRDMGVLEVDEKGKWSEYKP
jgi:outer membrane protein TolC